MNKPLAKTVNNIEYFEDDCETADVRRIGVTSFYISGSMALYKWAYLEEVTSSEI